MSNNIDDLASYLKLQSDLFSSNYASETVTGSAGGLFTDTTASVVASGTVPTTNLDGQSAWAVTPLDLLASPSPTFSYTVTNNLTNSNYVAVRPTLGLGLNFSADPNVVSLSDLYQFYQDVPYSANPTEWNGVGGPEAAFPATDQTISSNAFWKTASPMSQQILRYWNDIQTANGILIKTPPPSTFQQFVQAIQSIQMVPAVDVPAGNFVTAGQFSSVAVSALVTTPNPITLPTPAQISNGLLTSFIDNYQSDYPNTSGATITPNIFASQFEDYIQNKLSTALSNLNVSINLSDPSNTSGNTIVLKQIAASSLAGSSSLSGDINFPANFANQFATDLYNEYSSALQVATDWQGVTPPDLNQEANFQKAFSYFINQVTTPTSSFYTYFNKASTSAQGQGFFTLWSEFVGPSAFLQNASNGSITNELTTYEQMYNVFYPDQPQLFASRMSSFIQDALNSPSGVFNPSLLIDQWFTKLQQGFSSLTTSLDGANFSNVAIMNSLYQSIVDMITDIQNLTLAQANRLQFYSNYSESYTKAINSIPFLLPNDGTPIDASDADVTTLTLPPSLPPGLGASVAVSAISTNDTVTDSKLRQQGDVSVNQWIQNLQNYRATVSANAKTQQTSVQESNSNVNQQTNFATNILALETQLLQSIFNYNPISY